MTEGIAAPTVPRRDGSRVETPLFLPVYQPDRGLVPVQEIRDRFGARGLIVNGFLLYKNREIREQVLAEGLHDYIDFPGLLVTDSGAFQGLRGRVYLSNKRIVAFQDAAGADVVSPLDEITPPGDSYATARRKMHTTHRRLREARGRVTGAVLALVQQGGRFLDLREQATAEIASLEPRYIALGSLVPFLTRSHDIEFTGRVIRQARAALPPEVPIHLYGAGDPLELPFFLALGCDVFDSSSFAHYALQGYCMTPYGALHGEAAVRDAGYACGCDACREAGAIWSDATQLARHNLGVILEVLRRCGELRRRGELEAYLAEVLVRHEAWFPESKLGGAWRRLQEAR